MQAVDEKCPKRRTEKSSLLPVKRERGRMKCRRYFLSPPPLPQCFSVSTGLNLHRNVLPISMPESNLLITKTGGGDIGRKEKGEKGWRGREKSEFVNIS